VANGQSVAQDVVVTTNDTQLTLTVKSGTGPWSAKGTFFFLPIGSETAAPGGLDPGVDNGGQPPTSN
jgi:hypothetical protein